MKDVLIPFLTAFNNIAEGQLTITRENLLSIINLIPPRDNNAPSPYLYGLMTFTSVLDRDPIRLATAKITGIYCWVNILNGKCYVGKATNLYLRLSNYFQTRYIKRTLLSSLISRAINKYGMNNFSLVILEINPANLSEAEQYWIDLLSPEYNQEFNVIGSKLPRTPKPDRSGTNNSFFGREHTAETKSILRRAALRRVKPNKPGFIFVVHDTLLDVTTEYPSIRKGVGVMGWDQPVITKRLNNNITRLYRNRYLMYVIKPTDNLN